MPLKSHNLMEKQNTENALTKTQGKVREIL